MLKEKLINEFENNRGVVFSGQYLADKFDVSRNAVWKAINSLKEEGYIIESVGKKGYSMKEETDVISVTGICNFLEVNSSNPLANAFSGSEEANRNPIDIKVFQEIDSTNTEAKRMMASGNYNTTLIVASTQTNGRGRLGRTFYSPDEKGIYMTLLFRVKDGIKSPMHITMAAAVAILRAIKKVSDLDVNIKWVNDIFVGDKKVAGILTEATTDLESGRIENIAVGIGINLKSQDFPGDIKDIAGSLGINDLQRNKLIAYVTNELLDLYSNTNDDSFMDEYIENSFVVGKRVVFDQNNRTEKSFENGEYDEDSCGIVTAVERDGSLLITRKDGSTVKLISGSIQVI